jgi:hypothetical protein
MKRWPAVAAAIALVAFAAAATQTTARVTSCRLANGIRHVIYVQFDNTHYRRDAAAVPSDLQQMPALLNFVRGNGTLLTNDHTILIAHTAGGILSTLTGLYPDRMGQTVSNSFGYFKPDGTVGFQASFKYWTDVVDAAANPRPNMITTGGRTAPAPWVPYTRAGCNWGGVGTANTVLENTGTDATGDMTRVFGQGSPEWNEASTDRVKAQADFVGIAVHCAKGRSLCATTSAKPDPLPDEPGGYGGFRALFGAKYVNQQVNGGAPVQDILGNPIADPAGNPGFPGFDGMSAAVSLGYVAKLQESGVQVTYAYVSDAHDNHELVRASGPGESDYEAQLKRYNLAFANFFRRLAAHGITKRNTLFVFTVDEGDHYAGGLGLPAGCDGATTPCAYAHTICPLRSATAPCSSNQIGEVNVNVNGFLPAGEPPFSVHADSAPTFYVNGRPARTDPEVRKLEQDVAKVAVPDPYVAAGQTVAVQMTRNLADPVEEKALHMVNADPTRTPTFTVFALPDLFVQSGAIRNCPGLAACVDYHFAWNHGDDAPEIAQTWLGFVGPGVLHRGLDATTWSDHADARPTMLALLGLRDDYASDGRVLSQELARSAIPKRLRPHATALVRLAGWYKQLNAPFGTFGHVTLGASTRGMAGDAATYDRIETKIASLTSRRDALAARVRAALNAAWFGRAAPKEATLKRLTAQARSLVGEARTWATHP